MTIKYADRVLETSTTQGTGTLNLGGAQAGFQTFVAGVGTGAKVAYFIEDGTNWESGRGTVTAGSPNTLSRDAIVASSNSGLAVNWGAGTRNVFLGASSYFLYWRDENLNDTNQMATTSAGTGNAHVVTLTPTPLALSDGMIVRWRAPAYNTGAITVNINGLGAKNYVNNDLAAFASGKVKSGTIQEAIYNASQNRFERTTMLFGPDASGIAYNGALGSMTAEQAIDAVLPSQTGNSGKYLKTNGSAPSWGTILSPANYITGLTLSNAADANNDITVAVGMATDSTNAAEISLASAITKRLDATWAVGTNQGGIDTGSKATSTTYHIHLIKRPDTGVVDVLFSTSPTSPNMPTNYTVFRRIGSIVTDGSGNIRGFKQINDRFILSAKTTTSLSNPTTYTTIALAGMPTGLAYEAILNISGSGTVTSGINSVLYLLSMLTAEEIILATGSSADSSVAEQIGMKLGIDTNTSGQIQYKTSQSNSFAALSALLLGWVDYRGRNG